MKLKATLLATALTLGFSATHLNAAAVEKPAGIAHSDERLLEFLERDMKPTDKDVIKYLDAIYKESPHGYGDGDLTDTQAKIAKIMSDRKNKKAKDAPSGF